jgi:hypothetical protein
VGQVRAGVSYAVAVRDGVDLLTVLTVHRDPRGNVYANIPRPHLPGFEPHSSFHASGQHHAKSFNKKAFVRQTNNPPNQNFRGTEQVETLVIGPNDPRAINVPCQPSDFADVFEIPYADVQDIKQGRLCVDLAQPGSGHIIRFPGEKVLRQAVFEDAVPWIIVTLIDIGQTIPHSFLSSSLCAENL